MIRKSLPQALALTKGIEVRAGFIHATSVAVKKFYHR